MASIKITPEDLTRLSHEFEDASRSIRGNLSMIMHLMSRLDSSWQGRVIDEYMQRIEKESQHSENLAQVLLMVSDTLRKASQAYQESEDQLTSRISDMFPLPSDK